VEAFALFNVFYQAGILLGPLVGMALTGLDFRITCLVAAAIFAALSIVQIRHLPARRATDTPARADNGRDGVLAQWRSVVANRPFLLFATAMIGSYVLQFQVYLALPLEVRHVAGAGQVGTIAVAVLFAVSGSSTIAGQTRVTRWCKQHLAPGQALSLGLLIMGVAFVPLLVATALPVPGGGVGPWLLAAVPPRCRRSCWRWGR